MSRERHMSPAIVMRVREQGEGDLLVDYVTPDHGRLSGIAKAGKKSRERFQHCLDLFCLVQLEYEQRGGGTLCFLHSGRLLDAFVNLRRDFYALATAGFLVELLLVLFPQGVEEGEGFELLKASLTALDSGLSREKVRALFSARAMAHGGYRIDMEHCLVCGRSYKGEGRAIFDCEKGRIACLRCRRDGPRTPSLGPGAGTALRDVQGSACRDPLGIEVSEADVREILAVLRLHLDYRLGKRLKSGKFLDPL